MSVFNNETVLGLLVAGLSLVWNMVSKTKVGVAASAQARPGVQVASSAGCCSNCLRVVAIMGAASD